MPKSILLLPLQTYTFCHLDDNCTLLVWLLGQKALDSFLLYSSLSLMPHIKSISNLVSPVFRIDLEPSLCPDLCSQHPGVSCHRHLP